MAVLVASHAPQLGKQGHRCRPHATPWWSKRSPNIRKAARAQQQQQGNATPSNTVDESSAEEDEGDEDAPPLMSVTFSYSPDGLLLFLYRTAVRIVVYSTAIVLGMGSSSIMQVWLRAAVFMNVAMGLCIRDTWGFWEKVRPIGRQMGCSSFAKPTPTVQQAKTHRATRGNAGCMHGVVCGRQCSGGRAHQRPHAGNNRCV